MVGGVHYRQPGLWIKAATTLDVLSGGRAWLGIGAAWNEEESRALGFPFPPLGERFELLEDTLRMAHGMWSGERGSEATLEGHHMHAARLLNSPQSLSRPRVPIMIGGGGEKKTLRLVAQYGDACNVFGSPEGIARKYRILDEHCADGRARSGGDRALDAAGREPVARKRAAGGDRGPGRRPLRGARRRGRAAHHLQRARRARPGRIAALAAGDPGAQGAVAAQPGAAAPYPGGV